MISYLCKVAGVSRSGYYKYFSSESKDLRKSREDKDILSKENVLKAFNFKGRKKGARQIKMVLKDRFNIIYNLKRIRRIMKKYGIVCPYRKANPYRRMMKASKEHTIVSNFINREFKQDIPYKVLLTDITYLSYKNGKKAYLSTIKDSSTNEMNINELTDDDSFIVAKQIYEYGNIIKLAAEKNEPSIISRYLINLAQKFSTFYNNNKIIDDNKELQEARVILKKYG